MPPTTACASLLTVNAHFIFQSNGPVAAHATPPLVELS
jgi:hypothetical protein